MKRLIAIATLSVMIISVMTSCNNTGKISTRLSDKDKKYYENLSNYTEGEYRKSIENYIYTYVTKAGLTLSSEELELIVNLTSEDFFKSNVIDHFDMQKNNNDSGYSDITDDTEGDISDYDGDVGKGTITNNDDEEETNESEQPIDNGDYVISVFFSYKNSIYTVKAASEAGKIYSLFFKVKGGKVVSIYGA